MVLNLERRTRDWAAVYDEEQPDIYDPLDYVQSWVEAGNTLVQLAVDISEEVGFDISRAMVMRFLAEGRKANEVESRLAEARKPGGHAMLEQAVGIIDAAPTHDKEQLKKAELRAAIRERVAGMWNRAELGKQPDVSIVVNHNVLHLDAMRRRMIAPDATASLQMRERETAAPARVSSSSVSNGHGTVSVNQYSPEPDVIADVIALEPGEG